MNYTQFQKMNIPNDIQPIPVFKNRKEIECLLKRKVDISKTLAISLNTNQFRQNEIHIHTADIGSTYIPDFDFSDLGEFDAWRKTCRLKFNLQRFSEVDYVRCDNFLHKMQVCESLTLFEEVHRMLKPSGCFLITVDNLFCIIEKISKTNPSDLMKLYDYEKLLFSGTDSTGLYYNRTIWTFERLRHYLKKANFFSVENKSSSDGALKVVAVK
jgi:SAM-dependent methyltransferase